MTATLGASPYSNWQILAPLLEALGGASGEDTYPESWYLGQQSLPEGRLLLAYTYPEQALLCAMQKGLEPAKALQEWEEHTQALVSLYKINRHRAVIVNIQQATNNLERFAEAIASHWELDISLPSVEGKQDDTGIPDPYFQLLASYAVQQNHQLDGLLVQLEACTLPVEVDGPVPEPELDTDSLYRGISKLRERDGQLEALKAAQAKADEEQKQLAEAQKQRTEELNKLRTSLKAADTQYQQKRDEANRLQQALEQARQQGNQQKTALEAENQLVIEQLHLVQEELETSLKVHKSEQTAAQKLRAEIAALKAAQAKADEEQKQLVKEQKQLAEAQKQRTEELNKLRTSLKAAEAQYQQKRDEASRLQQELGQARQQGQQQKTALEAENQLVIEQLHLVQEELERQLNRKQSLENQVQKLSLEQKHALAAANNQIHRLQNELNQIKGSAAWKAIAPARAIGRPFKRTPPEKRKLKKQAEQLATTHYFDANWYLKTYPDIAENQANPAEHYLKFGAQEGRNPGPEFDTQWYVQANPDVQESGINPLIHFLNHGQEEGRAPNPRVQNSLPPPQEAK